MIPESDPPNLEMFNSKIQMRAEHFGELSFALCCDLQWIHVRQCVL